MPDRTAAALRDWLQQHLGVVIIVRDRSTEYASGATAGAPAAVQVADRWHLLQNLREELECLLHRRYAALARLPMPDSQSTRGDADIQNVGLHTALRIPTASKCIVSIRAREQRLVQYQAVRTLLAEGRNMLQIAKHLKMSRITVRTYVQAEVFPERAAYPLAPSMFGPLYLHQRWIEGCENAAQLWREICAVGYRGTRAHVGK